MTAGSDSNAKQGITVSSNGISIFNSNHWKKGDSRLIQHRIKVNWMMCVYARDETARTMLTSVPPYFRVFNLEEHSYEMPNVTSKR